MDIQFRKIGHGIGQFLSTPVNLYRKGERFVVGGMTFAMSIEGVIGGYGAHSAANGDVLGYPMILAGAGAAALTYVFSWEFNNRLNNTNRIYKMDEFSSQ